MHEKTDWTPHQNSSPLRPLKAEVLREDPESAEACKAESEFITRARVDMGAIPQKPPSQPTRVRTLHLLGPHQPVVSVAYSAAVRCNGNQLAA